MRKNNPNLITWEVDNELKNQLISIKNQMKRTLLILKVLFLMITVFSSCTTKQNFNKEDFIGKIWIYNSDSLSDSIRDFTDNYLVFDNKNVSLNSQVLGEFYISKDTLFIDQTSFILLKNGKYKKVVQNKFSGKIISASKDDILIKKISGFFPIKYFNKEGDFDRSEFIKLTNQENTKKEIVNFNYVSVAASPCFGSCPNYNIEVDSRKNVKFRGLSNCQKTGDFQGRITSEDLRKIEEIISYLNLKNDSTIFYLPSDAQETVVKLNVNNKEFYFKGNLIDFQLKLQHLIKELVIISEKSKMKKSNNPLNFKANLEILPPEKIIEFIPPIAN